MISEAFVWIFLPRSAEAVVCGRLVRNRDESFRFLYGRSYRERQTAIALCPEGMALGEAEFVGRRPGALPGPIRDAGPGAWARYAIEYRRGVAQLGELDLLLEGHGDRIGALEFSASATELDRTPLPDVSLADMEAAARGVQDGQPLPQHLLDALRHGTTIGGARPKAALQLDGASWVAKFSSTTDHSRVVRWEAAALSLAEDAGIRVPRHRLESVNARDVLLVERFDREVVRGSTHRQLMLTALTLLDLDDTEATLASYPDLSEALLRHAADPKSDRVELFRRMVFNILIGNEDDHAKNHACFWDGRVLRLTSAYDIVPQRRAGQEARQAMIVGERGQGGREGSLANALTSADRFGLEVDEARELAQELRAIVEERWESVFAEHGVPAAELQMLRGTTVLSPLAVEME